MHRAVLACLLGAWACAQAQVDPLSTRECAAARQQLDEAFAAGVPRERLNAARRQAARECLGRLPPPPPEGRFVPPPVAVAPIPVPAPPSLPAVVTAPPGPVAIPRAPAITSCDAAGCWDSNGQRHNQQGPVLAGPRGLCTVQSGLLACP